MASGCEDQDWCPDSSQGVMVMVMLRRERTDRCMREKVQCLRAQERNGTLEGWMENGFRGGRMERKSCNQNLKSISQTEEPAPSNVGDGVIIFMLQSWPKLFFPGPQGRPLPRSASLLVCNVLARFQVNQR